MNRFAAFPTTQNSCIRLASILWAWFILVALSAISSNATAQQDTSSLGLRLTQSVSNISNPTSSSGAAVVDMVYGDAAKSSADQVLTSLSGSADPRILAQTQSFGNGTQSIAQIEKSAKAVLIPQQTTLLNQMRAAGVSARVSGVIWVFAQTVRPLGSVRNMKLSWYLLIAPGGRVITSDPKVIEEDPTVVYMIYYSKAVGRSLPSSYAWADAGLIKWQLRRYDGTPVTGWSTIDVNGAYDSPESDSEQGPYCAATAETLSGCIQGLTTARSLMAENASRKSVIDYVRAVDVSYNPSTNGESTPDIKISFDTRVYTRTTCSVGTYRCAGTIGYTVVETLDRYTMIDTESLPTKVNSLTGLNSSRPTQAFDVSVSVSDKPAFVDPFVINPFDTPHALISTSQMPGIVHLASMSVEIPPTNGDYICPPGTTQQGTQCLSTSITPATANYSCTSGSLSGSQCVSTLTSPSTATTNYTCSTGTLVGSSCIITSSTPAKFSTTYNCRSGTLSGSSCVTSSTTTASQTTSLGCPSGGTLSGSTCTVSTRATYPASASTSNICASGGTLLGANCTRTTSSTTAATATTTCKNGVYLQGVGCHLSVIQSHKVCPVGSEPLYYNNQTGKFVCAVDIYESATTEYSCDTGSLSGSTCTSTTTSTYSATATTTYTCSGSDSLIGSTCYSSTSTSSSYGATPSTSYSCSSGTLSGSNCITTSSSPASETTGYSCSSGTLNGSSCIQSRSTPATSTASNTCSTGTLSGTSCISTSSTPASIGYSCTTGALSGNNCIITNSEPATWVPLTCPDQ